MHSVLRREWSRVTGGGGLPPCDRCGYGGGDEPFDFGPEDTFEIVFDDGDDDEEYCPECGRQVNVVVRFEEDL